MTMIVRILGVILLVGLFTYWHISAHATHKHHPGGTLDHRVKRAVSKWVVRIFQSIILVQLLGLSLFPMPVTISVQLLGLLLVIGGVWMCIAARKTLHDNWSHAAEYQIKSNHTLITNGIYAYVRHPIYSGFTIVLIGAELIAGSWLWIAMLAHFISAYRQGKREEKILRAHFGKQYDEYMKRSKMLILFIF